MKLNKKNIVVVMDTYFPDSRATTHIMQRILEQLSGLYEIYVFTLNLFNHTFEELPSQHNGIHISYADLSTKNLFLKKLNTKQLINTPSFTFFLNRLNSL